MNDTKLTTPDAMKQQNYASIDNLDSGWLDLYANKDNRDAVWSEEPPAFVSDIVAAIKPGQRVLEICAGDGRITRKCFGSAEMTGAE